MLSLFRIGSKPVLVVILFILVLFLPACSERSQNDVAVFKALDESLVNANLTLTRLSQTIYMSLEEKLSDPATSQAATRWQPKALTVKKYSSDIAAYIESLKDKLKKEAGFKRVAGKDLFNENGMKAVNTLFNEKGMEEELYGKLKDFRNDILSIDIQIDSAFRSTLLLTTLSSDIRNVNQQDISTNMLFNNISVMGALAMLNKFKNDILVAENRLAMFCNTRFTDHHVIYTYSAIVAQNYSHIKAGGKMEITAGVGYFSVSEANPEIIVNGKNIEIDRSGVAVYKFKAPEKVGKYIMQVKINFTDQDRNKQLITKDLEYTVTK